MNEINATPEELKQAKNLGKRLFLTIVLFVGFVILKEAHVIPFSWPWILLTLLPIHRLIINLLSGLSFGGNTFLFGLISGIYTGMVIKFSGRELSQEEKNKIALNAANASIKFSSMLPYITLGLLTMKLYNFINVSWLLVFSPILIPIVIAAIAYIIVKTFFGNSEKSKRTNKEGE
jgi:hypothetical protein